MAKRKAPSPVEGVIRRNVTLAPADAIPASELDLTPEEIATLKDPGWVTEDEADGIICDRRLKEKSIPFTKLRDSLR